MHSFLSDTHFSLNFFIGVFIAGLVALISYKVKFLTKSGAIATFILASLIFGLGGIKWSVPIMAFFVLSSLLSKLRKSINPEVETYFEKSGVRDHIQVAANGGTGGLLVILYFFYHAEIFYFVYAASLASVCADTWATEIGTLFNTKTYNILNFKEIHQGISGGVSINGFIGAIAGSVIIALSSAYWIEGNLYYFLFLIIFSGLLGCIFDSILGASIQGQFECTVCGKVTEKILHCSSKTFLKKGFSWLNNDMVNFFAGIAGGIFIIIFIEFLFI